MPNPAEYVWFELVTSDQDAAEIFYTEVIGWTMEDGGMPDFRYTMASVGERAVCGIMTLEEVPPAWLGFVAVDDVDAYAARVVELGGAINKPAEEIPGGGRFAVVADPQGAEFVLYKGASANPPAPMAPMATGSVGWHELHTRDRESAVTFYGDLFGWTKGEAIEAGAIGIYQLFETGGRPIGGMMNNPGLPHPAWLYYFVVDDIDAGKARLEAAGGRIVNGPMAVPGGAWVLQAADPQGAMFALMGPRKDAADQA